jgi:hypothetical protein
MNAVEAFDANTLKKTQTVEKVILPDKQGNFFEIFSSDIFFDLKSTIVSQAIENEKQETAVQN